MQLTDKIKEHEKDNNAQEELDKYLESIELIKNDNKLTEEEIEKYADLFSMINEEDI